MLNGLASYVGYSPNRTVEVLRLIDKLDRLGWENVSGELGAVVNLDSAQLAKLKTFLDLRTGSPEETTTAILELMSASPEAVQGARELAEITAFVDALGVPRSAWQIDLSVARGLGYYTGTVFETMLLDLPSIGSVFSGGRYDDLVSRFGEDSFPATGASVGVDRLFAALETLELVPSKKTVTQVVVLNFEDVETYCNQVVGVLRRSGISAELYLGRERTMKGQLAYALNQDVPVIVIAGRRECDAGVVQVKQVTARKQTEVTLADLSEAVKAIIA